MFTGIISDIGTVRSVARTGDTRVVIDCGYDTATIDLGASIACSGVCLTVVDKAPPSSSGGEPGWFAVDVSGETRSRTADGQWVEGRRLNLERALRLGDELGGHIVTGHVDGLAEVIRVEPDGDSTRLEIAVPAALAPFVAGKGSVTVDGVSLTVNRVLDDDSDGGADDGSGRTWMTLNIIPHTQGATTLGDLAPGQSVNIEIDVLARYLMRMETYRRG
ncbi:riboflavin synthase [uncultured Sphingomonas sp.]|uniref:riboflavin synthase n=1 Tax=uncultured Sphingomonas sp. TaxID=158754 RepID=UPI0035CA7189